MEFLKEILGEELFTQFESKINEKTKAVIVNSPNNPSGAVYSEDTVKKLAAILDLELKL